MNSLGIPIFMSWFALAACSTYPKSTAANDSIIGSLSDSQRAPIDQARVEHDRCGDELANARQTVVRAKAKLTVARKELKMLEAHVDKAKAVVTVAETGTHGDLDAALEKLQVVEASTDAQHNLIHWRECEVKLAEKGEVVAEREQAHAAANVELEKARAYSLTNLASSTDVDVPKFETEVRECLTRVSHAQVELESAARECAVAQQACELTKPPKN